MWIDLYLLYSIWETIYQYFGCFILQFVHMECSHDILLGFKIFEKPMFSIYFIKLDLTKWSLENW